MFRRFSTYSFLIVTGWLLIALLIGYIFPDKKLGAGFTISVLIVLTQLVVIAVSLVSIIIRAFMVKTMSLSFGYTLTAMFNFGLGLIGIYLLIENDLAGPFIIVFGINLLSGILMLSDAAHQSKRNFSEMQNTI